MLEAAQAESVAEGKIKIKVCTKDLFRLEHNLIVSNISVNCDKNSTAPAGSAVRQGKASKKGKKN